MDEANQASTQTPKKGESAIKQAGRFRRMVKAAAAVTTVVVSGAIYLITRRQSGSDKDS